MIKPTLVIMAAGMGSRYGGLKQIDPVDAQGHIIMDFSIYDAMAAGFEKVVFIIKRANEQVFKESIGRNRLEPAMQFSVAKMCWTGLLWSSMQMIIMANMRIRRFMII